MEIPSGRKFELQLFKFCKVNEEAETANVGVLLWELEKMGITKQDARIQPIIEVFRRHRKTYILGEGREDVFGEDALSTVELDFHQFCRALSTVQRSSPKHLWANWSSQSSRSFAGKKEM